MSIRVRLKELPQTGDLLFMAPTIASSGSVRDVFVSKEVQDFLWVQNGVDQSFERAAGRALAKIDSFASGKPIVLALNPFNKSPATVVARNKPTQQGIVDLRVTIYQPDARIFGAFAETDALVLLTWAPKTGLHYATQVKRCRTVWDSLFVDLPPHMGETDAAYISSNVIAG